MGSSKSKPRKQLLADASDIEPERPWSKSDVGLVLLDPALKPIAFNREAAVILSYPNVPSAEQTLVPCIPDEILDAVRSRGSSSNLLLATYFNAGQRKYVCQAYSMTCSEPLPRAVIALLLHRKSSATEAINEVAADFRLTKRETQALSGICLGLSSKDLAKQMNISPNTVKAFLRIVMVKMGVTTRAAVVAKILELNIRMDVKTLPAPSVIERAAGMHAS